MKIIVVDKLLSKKSSSVVLVKEQQTSQKWCFSRCCSPAFGDYISFSSSKAAKWWLERHHFCDACCSWTSRFDELFLEQNISATICLWTVHHVAAIIFVPVLFLWLLQSVNNKCCWKLQTFNMSSLNILTLCTLLVFAYILHNIYLYSK